MLAHLGVAMAAGLLLPAAEPHSLLVMPLAARAGVSTDLAEQVTVALAEECGKRRKQRTVTFREIESALTQEEMVQIAGCDSASCAAEIAGALNAEEIVFGSLGRVGNEHLLQVSLVRARDASVLQRTSLRVPAVRAGQLLDRMPRVVDALLGPVTAAQTSSSAPAASKGRIAARVVAIVSGGAALVCAVVFAGLGATAAGVLVFDVARGDWNRTPRSHAVSPLVALAGDASAVGSAAMLVLVVGLLATSGGALAGSLVLP